MTVPIYNKSIKIFICDLNIDHVFVFHEFKDMIKFYVKSVRNMWMKFCAFVAIDYQKLNKTFYKKVLID